ncbi:hypothetical protein CMEL01_13127 [Colletotrichum melonis]|uniref:Uncharacterized protein n=1 Tax=Colletotrichum melonis TaxID=1209925 RepID=A0AAI9XUJ8_9PEZI|nr:hypothetical protein CMEL01_13127 [Colletotrichum melonis]
MSLLSYKTYRFLGDFELPYPDFTGMPKNQVQQIIRLEQKLRLTVGKLFKALDREVRVAQPEALEKEWAKFKATEPSLEAWAGYQGNHHPRNVVKWSGQVEASLAINLHYPPAAKKEEDEEPNLSLLEVTSPCITRLMSSGLSVDNALWFDTFCRREALNTIVNGKKVRFLPWEHYPEEIRQHHLHWIAKLHQGMAAKVHLVFGKFNRIGMKKLWEDRSEDFVLWDERKTELLIVYPAEGDRSRIERVVMFFHHPEYLMHKYDLDDAIKYDVALDVAARMCRIVRTENQRNYQEWKTARDKAAREEKAAEGKEKKYGKKARAERPVESHRGKYNLKGDGIGLSESVETACPNCGKVLLDQLPYGWVKDPQFYLTVQRSCKGPDGTMPLHRIGYTPTDPEMIFITPTAQRMARTPAKVMADIAKWWKQKKQVVIHWTLADSKVTEGPVRIHKFQKLGESSDGVTKKRPGESIEDEAPSSKLLKVAK